MNLHMMQVIIEMRTFLRAVLAVNMIISLYIIYIIISPKEEKEDRDEDNFVKHQF